MLNRWLTFRPMSARLSNCLLRILAVIGLLPSPASDAAIAPDFSRRVETIRQRLLDADIARDKHFGQGQDTHAEINEPLAGWYNFPNWPNWSNWSNWANGWRNW